MFCRHIIISAAYGVENLLSFAGKVFVGVLEMRLNKMFNKISDPGGEMWTLSVDWAWTVGPLFTSLAGFLDGSEE